MEKITLDKIKASARVLVKYTKIHKRDLILLSVLSVVTALGHGFAPYVLGKFFDSLSHPVFYTLQNGTVSYTIIFLSVWVFVKTVSSFFDWKINIKSEILSNLVWLDYISSGFGRIFEMSMSFHKKHKIGTVGDKITKSAQAIYQITGKVLIGLSSQFLTIFVALSIAFHLNTLLATLLVGGMIVYVVILILNVKPLHELQEKYWVTINDSFGDAYDALGNTLSIKQSGAEKHEYTKIVNSFQNSLPNYFKMTKIWENLSLSQHLTILITQSTIFLTSLFFITKGLMSVGDLITFFAYTGMMFEPFVVIGHNWQLIHGGFINIHASEKLLSEDFEIYTPKNSKPFEVVGDISFKNVSFYYDESKPVIKNISFEVKRGETIALVGESGVGKSTVIDLISGYHFPITGSVLIDGIETKELNLKSLRSQISVVPQEVVLFNDTILKNIKYGNFNATDLMIEGATKKAHALEFIEKMPEKWNQIVGERGIKLSVGQKQRISIARAILRNPKILILDEPTSALDASSEKIITESFEELMNGRTTFIVAHRLSTVRRAHKILVFKDGEIIESGNHEELLKIKGGEYKRLYELQIGLHT